MEEYRPVDLVVAAILMVALLRGVFLGLIREAFSIAALGAAIVCVRAFNGTAAAALADFTGMSDVLAPWLTGAALAAVTIALVAMVGRGIRRGAQAAGLGWADRAGGAALGFTEGALVASLLLLVAIALVGRDHEFIEASRSLDAFDRLATLVDGADLPAVAAPPRR